ncbi:hypothetical protein LTR64_007377 [Lithohypha guttulata]|uniref:uncharacterized protein n=1 Tax=Lithohypha guttulata TaxID=1690604 RepID=UPI00315DD11F
MPKVLRKTYDLTRSINKRRRIRTTGTPMLELPAEILLLTFKSIEHPYDQIAFMLSCKHLAKIGTDVKLNKQMFDEQPDFGKRRFRAYSHSMLVRKMYKWGFISKDLQFCQGCVKYLPKNRIWRDSYGIPLKDMEYVDWMWAINRWIRGGAFCPTCQVGHVVEGRDWLQSQAEGLEGGVLVRRRLRVRREERAEQGS